MLWVLQWYGALNEHQKQMIKLLDKKIVTTYALTKLFILWDFEFLYVFQDIS